MKKEYITIPNIITSIRLLGAIILIFLKPLSIPFYIVYAICGASDAVDGFAARKLGGVTEFGSKLDSVSDLAFFGISLFKLLPILYEILPKMIWNFVAVVLVARIIFYIINYIHKKELLASHSYLNKATTVMLFFLPFLINTFLIESYAWMLIGIALVSVVYEFTFSLYRTFYKKKK